MEKGRLRVKVTATWQLMLDFDMSSPSWADTVKAQRRGAVTTAGRNCKRLFSAYNWGNENFEFLPNFFAMKISWIQSKHEIVSSGEYVRSNVKSHWHEHSVYTASYSCGTRISSASWYKYFTEHIATFFTRVIFYCNKFHNQTTWAMA